MQRRNTKIVNIGNTPLGGTHPVRVQSMTDLPTSDIEGQIKQIKECAEAGAEYMRITVPTLKDVEHFKTIKLRLRDLGFETPIIADVHFSPKIAIAVAEFADKVRINPGNFILPSPGGEGQGGEVYSQALHTALKPLLSVCKTHNTALRIGTNHGSLSERIMERYGDTPEGMVVATMEAVEVCLMEDFHDIVLSLKSSNVRVMVEATRLLVKRLDEKGWNYPVHLGVTEAGNDEEGRIKSAVGIGSLLVDGIGDTIRVSLTEDPQKEIPVAYNILQASRARITKTDYIACPGCGRTQFGLQETLQRVKAATAHLTGLKIAVMGCIVNGPGEMADADYGYVGAGNGKVHLYKGKEQILKNIPEEEAIEEMLKLIGNNEK
ncbi:MAG: (E)-4-hydroxy-3-methylbut-2-enyl-diphosphate synthase [Bacteroidales bacterium]|nr:(E)-4-hydroxy-3-methylbut-2-enyl-diphosphate synthase [Bacteroidales bacterium]